MNEKLWGVPLVVWGGMCSVMTVLWIIVWPKDKALDVDVVRVFILRWFHALAWLLLTIAAFLAAFHVAGGASTARMVALLSLVVYIIFMGVVLTIR